MPSDAFRPSLSVAVLGHVDAGKSTLVGHLRFLCGCVAPREMDALAREAAAQGKASFKFAWLSDKSRQARERGITIDAATTQLLTAARALDLVDVPGHRSFARNAIAGAAQTDCAVLVVDATRGAFEAGMADDGQTQEHALLAFALGIKQLVVAVNKMDAVAYAAERFRVVQRDVAAYLARLGFQDSDVQYVPVGAWDSENLATKSAAMPWFEDGPTLLAALANLAVPRRSPGKPLRMPVQDVFKIGGVGTVVVGRVETGVLRPGMRLAFGPQRVVGTAVSLEAHHRQLGEASSGMSVGVSVEGVAADELRRGCVASDADHDEAQPALEFTAQVVVLNPPALAGLRAGYAPVVHCHTAQVACRIERITAKLDRASGAVVDKAPTSAQRGDACVVVMTPTRPCVLEAFSEYPKLGRVVLRDAGVVVAVGIVRSVTKRGGKAP